MPTALVTGGAGFIGSHLVDELVAKSYDVAVLDNFSNGKREYISSLPSQRVFTADIRDRDQVARVVKEFQPDIVYHLAAIHFIPYCLQHPYESFQINAMGTKVLLDSLEPSPPKVLFFASTAAVYGPSLQPHQEAEPLAPMDPYGLSKVCGEEMAQLFASRHPSYIVVGRFFNAIGPRETNPHLLPDIINQLNRGQRQISLGNLEPKRDFLHVRDMAKAVLAVTEMQKEGVAIYNIGSGKQYSVLEVVQCCEKILNEKIEIMQKAQLKRKVERPSLLAGIDKIRAAVGWQPTTSLQATLEELLAK